MLQIWIGNSDPPDRVTPGARSAERGPRLGLWSNTGLRRFELGCMNAAMPDERIHCPRPMRVL